MDFGFALSQQFETAVEEQGAKDVNDPVEAVDEAYAGEDEDASHDERPNDSPEQNLVLVVARHLEITEDDQEHEQIVDTEREFDHIAGDELKRRSTAVPVENYD